MRWRLARRAASCTVQQNHYVYKQRNNGVNGKCWGKMGRMLIESQMWKMDLLVDDCADVTGEAPSIRSDDTRALSATTCKMQRSPCVTI